ncbi:alpha-ketoglutarate-dependent dioxygenase AlkB [Dokdonia sinensis]|uniref:Alpha-ketoglutarate-dependent dioxygenase AlkB n=1 Tax=Dokdonia sinensis TaxID=2479847 RepID=A0A3M0GH34_9FLAO|nr:alpha-ketoglutarate-dependent dioxygenase AlkB [Dokdonia sinensis]RMB60449.1 alpha-ketoglutarate-dependent dioxygenase AlkB [Dokdonia sinensis]
MSSLFSNTPQHLPLKGATVTYFPDFFSAEEAGKYFALLHKETPWQQDDIKVFGKVYPQPRLTALYGNNGKPYSYSNITMQPHEYTFALSEIKKRVEKIAQVSFTTCLLNLYRDGQDSNGWHADDENELGENPVIASVSFGAERVFKFREKANIKNTYKMTLNSGSLLLMQGSTQHLWQHQIPKTAKNVGPRINLTFRIIK